MSRERPPRLLRRPLFSYPAHCSWQKSTGDPAPKDIARKCGVSEVMAKYRLDVTGVARQNQALLKNRRAPR